MTPEEIGQQLVAALGADSGASYDVAFEQVTVDVPTQRWVEAATLAKTAPGVEATYFDFLTGVDELADGFRVVLHVWSPEHRHHVLLRTIAPRDDPRVPTLTAVYAGAAWHERETWEMFGIVFDGHPNLVPLLLPDGFEGHPLRKEFVLASRVIKEWPGAKEPGESHSGATRRRMMPPGVPDNWGPNAVPEGDADAAEPEAAE